MFEAISPKVHCGKMEICCYLVPIIHISRSRKLSRPMLWGEATPKHKLNREKLKNEKTFYAQFLLQEWKILPLQKLVFLFVMSRSRSRPTGSTQAYKILNIKKYKILKIQKNKKYKFFVMSRSRPTGSTQAYKLLKRFLPNWSNCQRTGTKKLIFLFSISKSFPLN